ncbi:hypothetical protein OKJ99_08735, partial [Streptomyces endophyticus]|nr:hypothetical protein [Streptomyces endophyticus]
MPAYVDGSGGAEVGGPLVGGVEGADVGSAAGPEGAGAAPDLEAFGDFEALGEADFDADADFDAERVAEGWPEAAGPAAPSACRPPGTKYSAAAAPHATSTTPATANSQARERPRRESVLTAAVSAPRGAAGEPGEGPSGTAA